MLAYKLHKTVAELLYGRPFPLSAQEAMQWNQFFRRKGELEKQAMDQAEKDAKRKG